MISQQTNKKGVELKLPITEKPRLIEQYFKLHLFNISFHYNV